jgi:hypothetical protein
MLKHISIAILFTLLQSLSAKAEWTATNQYVTVTLMSVYGKTRCGINFTPESLDRYGDKIGADGPKLRLAIVAAIHANGNDHYEHADIIPAVTEQVLDFFRETNAVSTAEACGKLIPILKNIGITK